MNEMVRGEGSDGKEGEGIDGKNHRALGRGRGEVWEERRRLSLMGEDAGRDGYGIPHV